MKKLWQKYWPRYNVQIFLGGIALSVLLLVLVFKHNRARQVENLSHVNSAASAPAVGTAAPSVPTLQTSPPVTTVDTSAAEAQARRAEAEANERHRLQVLQQVRKEIQASRAEVKAATKRLQAASYTVTEVQNKISRIAAIKDLSENERSNEYVELRNQIAISKTSPALKRKLVEELDQKISSAKVPPYKGFDKKKQPEGNYEFTPRR